MAPLLLPELAKARGALGDAEERLLETLRTFAATEAGLELTWTRFDLAALVWSRGRRETGATQLAEAHRQFRALGLPRWVERAEERARDWGVAL